MRGLQARGLSYRVGEAATGEIRDNKSILESHRKSPTDFTRDGQLSIEHTVGLVLHMAASRNENGYDITSQNYFEELGEHRGSATRPVTRQSISEARGKLKWQGFEALLSVANRERQFKEDCLRYKGHITRAVDGTSMIVPRSEELLRYFTPRTSRQGEGHYPSLLAVTAMNVFTGQPIAARIGDHTDSERDGLLSMIRTVFKRGDLSLLDRGLPAGWLFWEFEKAGQFYLSRMKTTGDRAASYVQSFVKSEKKSKVIRLEIVDVDTQEKVEIKVRLVRGPMDSEGKRIVFATNLIGEEYTRKSILKLYRERWAVETLYGRMKNLLKVERFHARSYNGVMQEIFANLLVLSLTALVWSATICRKKMNPRRSVPSFKNAVEVVRRHLFDAIDHRITGRRAKELTKRMIEQTNRVMWKKQPGRNYPRVSMQPIKVWNLAKVKKLAEFAGAKRLAG
jgi:hypothetical protein